MTLREELINTLDRLAIMNRERASAQARDTSNGMLEALRYKIKAETYESVMFEIHSILSRYGL